MLSTSLSAFSMNSERKKMMGKVLTGSNNVRSLLTRFPPGRTNRMKNKRQKTFIVTALVDYKIKSFEKRVVRDKTLEESENERKSGSEWSLAQEAQAFLRTIHQMVNPLKRLLCAQEKS
jgi:hypothetical protein